jgi:3-methyladenine DNA glycosylase AlkC
MRRKNARVSRRASTCSRARLPRKKIKKLKQLRKTGKFEKGSRMWVFAKKERQRRKGMEVRKDTKYTGRRRKGIR